MSIQANNRMAVAPFNTTWVAMFSQCWLIAVRAWGLVGAIALGWLPSFVAAILAAGVMFIVSAP